MTTSNLPARLDHDGRVLEPTSRYNDGTEYWVRGALAVGWMRNEEWDGLVVEGEDGATRAADDIIALADVISRCDADLTLMQVAVVTRAVRQYLADERAADWVTCAIQAIPEAPAAEGASK
jgi:hypothetical protein